MNIGAALGESMGPLPMWAWIGVGGAGLAAVGAVMKGRGAPKGSAQEAPVAVNPFALLPPGGFGGADGGGGGGGGGTTPLDCCAAGTCQCPGNPPGQMGPGSGPQTSPLPVMGLAHEYPRCIDARPGEHCYESYINQGGNLYVGLSRPDIGLVPAGSAWWDNLSRTFSSEMQMIPHFQFGTGGTIFYGTPPPGVPVVGYPGLPGSAYGESPHQ